MNQLTKHYLHRMVMIGLFVFGIIAGIFWYYSRELPPLSELQNYQMSSGSEVYDCNGRMIYLYAYEYRKLTNFSELPDNLIKALITIEDNNFYKHWGVDIFGTMRAFLVDIVRMDFAQGASTITQQLARNMFLTLDKQLPRKIKEAMLAVMIEKNYSKNEILEIYLNKIYFGNGVYGVETAAMRYFGKKAKDLSTAECATLAGVIQRPNYYSPILHPDHAYERRNFVLKRMLQEKRLSQEEFDIAISEPLILHPTEEDRPRQKSNYFIEYLRVMLEKKYGADRLFGGGLKIYTTLDMDLQEYADSVMNKQLTYLENLRGYPFKYKGYNRVSSNIKTPYLQGGVYSIEPETGYVRVMIGGRNFEHSKFNRIVQAKRQPGSAFKPLLYVSALERGYTPATVIYDGPMAFVQSDTIFWEPKNYEKRYYGYTRMRDAIKRSQNIYAIKTIFDIGPDAVIKTAQNFGLTYKLLPVYSLAVGSCEVIPKQLIEAFTVFPNNGNIVKPQFILKIEDRMGNVIERANPQFRRVIDPRTAYLMNSMLESVVNEGTANGVRAYGYHQPAAGKTGTTDDYRDGWFIGFNKKLCTGVWVGFDNNSPMGSGMSGSMVAIPVWSQVMGKATEQYQRRHEEANYNFTKPDGVVQTLISKTTGLLPKNGADPTMYEYFIQGTEPSQESDSTSYNFYPTHYRTSRGKFIIRLGK